MTMKNTITIFATILFFALFAASASAGSISGYVTDTANNPIENVSVALFYFNDTYTGFEANTTSTGYYNVVFDVGDYTGFVKLNYTKPGLPPVIKMPGSITNDSVLNINTTMGPPIAGNFTGYVTDTSGPISGAIITITGPLTYTVTTDASGYYNIAVAAPSTGTYTYTLTATATMHNSATNTSTIANNETKQINFSLTSVPTTGNIHGIVYNGSLTRPVANALVSLKVGTGTIYSVNTDATGFYNITAEHGNYNLTASAVGFNLWVSTQRIDIGSDITRDINLTSPNNTCPQSAPVCGPWSDCVNKLHSRTCTIYNYTGVCGNTYVYTETESCGHNSGGGGGGGSGGGTFQENWELNFTAANPFTVTWGRYDTLTFKDCKDQIKNIQFTKLDLNNAVIKILPLNKEYELKKNVELGINLDNELGYDLKVTLLDTKYTLDKGFQATTAIELICKPLTTTPKPPVTQPKNETQEENEEEQKPLTGLLKILGKINPIVSGNVAVGIGITLATILAGLGIFWAVMRRRY